MLLPAARRRGEAQAGNDIHSLEDASRNGRETGQGISITAFAAVFVQALDAAGYKGCGGGTRRGASCSSRMAGRGRLRGWRLAWTQPYGFPGGTGSASTMLTSSFGSSPPGDEQSTPQLPAG